MYNKYKFSGNRLKKARIYRGFTVAGLAEQVGYQRQTISLYESNQIDNPDEHVIKKISDVLSFPVKYFFEQDKNLDIGSTYFRALLTTNKKYRNEQIQRMEYISQIYCFLKEYINFPKLVLPQIDSNTTPEEAADMLRDSWNLGCRPIENIIFDVEQHGIVVTSSDTGTSAIDAYSQMVSIDGDSVFTIGYSNNKTSAARIHFDISHELGHICLHDWSEDVEMLNRDEFKEREDEANRFASSFLLPKDTFYYDVKKNPTSLPFYKELKRKWKVSMQAMIRRAYSLEIISYEEYQYLIRTLQRRGMRKEEPLDNVLLTAKPSLLKTAVQMLLNEKVFTPKEFVDELSFSYNLSLYPNEIENLLNLPKDTLKISNIIPIHNLQII